MPVCGDQREGRGKYVGTKGYKDKCVRANVFMDKSIGPGKCVWTKVCRIKSLSITSENQGDITCDSLEDVTWSHGTHDVNFG